MNDLIARAKAHKAYVADRDIIDSLIERIEELEADVEEEVGLNNELRDMLRRLAESAWCLEPGEDGSPNCDPKCVVCEAKLLGE